MNIATMHNPAHPGEVLRAYLPENISVTDMAPRLEATLGIEASFWMSIQAAHDRWQARQKAPHRDIPRIAA